MQGGATGQFFRGPAEPHGRGSCGLCGDGELLGIAAREAAKYGKVLRAFDGGAESSGGYRASPS